MKKILILIMTAAMMIMMFGCSPNQTKSEVVEDVSSMFIKVEDAPAWDVYYHKDTKVMYAVSSGGYNNGNFIVLVNADGSPMLWKE